MRHPPVTDTNKPHKLSRKDFDDYEFIVGELARMAKMTFPEIKKHHERHPEDDLYTLRHPKDGNLMRFTREGMKRFWQISRRGLKSLGPDGNKYNPAKVVDEIQKLFLGRILDNPSSVNDEQSHDIFLEVIAKISGAFLPSTHYVPCTLVAHRRPPQFRIGPVEFQLSQIFWENNGQAILAGVNHDSQQQPIREFFTRHMWMSSVEVGPCDPAVGEKRARGAIQSSLDLFKLFAGRGRGARIGHAYLAGLPGTRRHCIPIQTVSTLRRAGRPAMR